MTKQKPKRKKPGARARRELIWYYRGRVAQIDVVMTSLQSERAAIFTQIRALSESPHAKRT